ncbi:hypothetical protein ABTX77_30400 [Streptomyces sp. NPDC097704]|uniref:hypothetical protein n=1 Tax=Streptomyces sp. NPDC097704 TaxID=3157101 RepID=UPI0033233DAD
MFAPDGPPNPPGPTAGLTEVLSSYEAQGHADPAEAWRAFTRTWNWAAPLTAALPPAGLPRIPVTRPSSGGFGLSGVWHLPSPGETGPWVALPTADGRQQPVRGTTEAGSPDLFVVPTKSLPGARGRHDHDASPEPGFRLIDLYVPIGFATYTTGTPLRTGDAAFFWTAVVAMALGAARRMTDVLSYRTPSGNALRETGAHTVLQAELAALLHDERLSLVATLIGCPTARDGLPPDVEERIAARVRQVANVVHHVLAAAYQHVLALGGNSDRHPLVAVIEAGSPILQQARYATELLPHDRTPRRKAEHGDHRRVPG